MKVRRGFTVIEVMIVIAIMAILLVIGTVMYRGYQASARDKERESDVAALQAYLESIYPVEIKDDSGNIIKLAGTYPALPEEKDDDFSYLDRAFADLDAKSMTPPGVGGANGTLAPDVPPSGLYIPAEGDITSAYCSGSSRKCYVRPSAINPTIHQYIYAPGPSSNELCTIDQTGYTSSEKCRRYTIFYRTEGGGVQKVESKHK